MGALVTSEEWDKLLKSFANALNSVEWPGNPAASMSQLLKAEQRLKIALPPSYRAFLAASNGWRQASREVPVLRSVEKIRWFKKEHREWVEAYTGPMQSADALLPAERDYFNYALPDSASFDVKHLPHALCISEIGDDAVLLLNPMVIWPDGEWETWLFANWLPGAMRFRSFADWMQQEFAKICDKTFEHSLVVGELPTVYLDGPAKANRRVRPREEMLSFEQALKKLDSKTRANRTKAVRQLARMGDSRAIQRLLDLLKADYDYNIRCEAAEILGRIRAQEAIVPLIEASTEESYVTSSAIEALGNFNDEISAKRLIDLVEEDGNSAGVAVYALARRTDSRAVPPLVRKLLSKDPRDQHTGSIAGRFIAQFNKPGYLALEPLVEHKDTEVRQRAISGIFDIACVAKDKELKMEARKRLSRCLETESNDALRHHLEICIAVASNQKPPAAENPFADA